LPALPYETTPLEVKRKLDAGERVVLVDVREPFEQLHAGLEGAHLIPMATIPGHLQQLDAAADEATLIVFCHHGMRSLSVVNWLRQQGVDACQSMHGGIDRWSLEIDPGIPRYY
jgi:rhodanese-related sulfurtransferase